MWSMLLQWRLAIQFFYKSDGSLWGMGGNGAGELGDGTYESKNQPVKIEIVE